MNYIEFLLAFAAFQLGVCALVGGCAWLSQTMLRKRRTRALAQIMSLNSVHGGLAPQPSTNHG